MSARGVCMLVHNPFRHDARVEREARTLAEAGYDVRVIAARGAGTARSERRDGYRVLRVDSDPLPTRVVRYALAAAGRPAEIGTVASPPAAAPPGPRGRLGAAALRAHLFAELLRFQRRTARAAAAEPAAVWVAHDLDALPAAWWARRRRGGRLLYDSHELFGERIAIGRGARPLWRVLERALAPRADAVVTVGEGLAAELARRYPIAPPVVVRNLPVSAASGGGESPLRAALGLDEDRRVSLYLGGLQPGRGLETLARAAARLPADHAIVLMGPGRPDYVAGLRAAAARAGATERLLVAPPVQPEEVVRWATGADAGLALIEDVSLSYRLALPNKLFECVAAGLPVVASDLPELRRVVAEHGLGVTCEPDDPDAVARAIRFLLDDPQRHARLRDAVRAAARELTWERESRVLVELVDRLAAAG